VQSLQHHHHRDDPRRHRVAANLSEEIRKFLVGKQTVALARQQALERFRPQPRLARGRVERCRPPSARRGHERRSNSKERK